MAIFYSINENAFYDDRVPVAVPPDAIEITETERNQMLNAINSGGFIEIKAGRPQCVAASAPSLDEKKVALSSQIDTAAEVERLKYITGGGGQSLTYQEKVAQAVAYSKAFAAFKTNPKENAEPNADEYLLLQASLGIDGDTLAEVAETVTYAYAMWQQIGAAIENIRLKAKADLKSAKTAEEAQKIYDAISWPS